MNLSNKTVLVTGANRGIGRAIVDALLAEDVKKIYASARSTDSLPDFGDDRVAPIQLDITDAESINNAAAAAGDAIPSAFAAYIHYLSLLLITASVMTERLTVKANMSIDEENGRMVLSAAGDDAGFVIFGACTPK